jgi:hypothetical protein
MLSPQKNNGMGAPAPNTAVRVMKLGVKEKQITTYIIHYSSRKHNILGS